MALLRYTASADTTIVNAFQPNLRTRGTGANAGLADVMEVFSIYGQEATGSQELSRILVKFPTTSISTDRTNSVIPASGSVSFYMRLFNAVTSKTVPKDFKLLVAAVSQSWQEGVGLDLEGYADLTRATPAPTGCQLLIRPLGLLLVAIILQLPSIFTHKLLRPAWKTWR